MKVSKQLVRNEFKMHGLNEEKVWEVLRTCYDPEIPVNIVDLGLIYGIKPDK